MGSVGSTVGCVVGSIVGSRVGLSVVGFAGVIMIFY